MAGNYLLDTNILIAARDGDDDVRNRMMSASRLYVSSVVVGEFFYSAANSTRPKRNRAIAEAVLKPVRLLTIDRVTAERFAEVKATLKQMGRPIPDNDVWIAASALQHDVTLVTRDAHFSSIAVLRVDRW